MTAQDLLLADEPTGNLDPATADKVFAQFREAQRERGLAAVVATHNEKLARRWDRVLRLRDGVLVSVRSPEPEPEPAGAGNGPP
jgi:lipoprotein-releasing system ATP-binding protein